MSDSKSNEVKKPSSKPAEPKSTNAVLSGLLLHSIAMVLVPFLLFYGTANGYLDYLLSRVVSVPTPDFRNTAAAILSVIGVNVVVGHFVLTAFNEDKPVKSKKD